jgi:hypothetical protein
MSDSQCGHCSALELEDTKIPTFVSQQYKITRRYFVLNPVLLYFCIML